MINIKSNNTLARWFVWSCDHLPLTTGTYQEDDKEHSRSGAHYIQNGTTLCHIFWAILWVPLISVSLVAFVLSLFVMVHITGHNEFVASHPYSGQLMQASAYFIPEAIMLVIGLVVGLLIFAIIGGSKSGFFGFLWQYLKGVKQRVCPLVRFDGAEDDAKSVP